MTLSGPLGDFPKRSRGPILGNVLLDRSVQSRLELGSISKSKEKLHPHEERSQEECLNKVVHESRGSTFENSVSDELSKPAKDMKDQSPIVGRSTVLRCEVIGVCGGGEEQWGQQTSGHRFHQDVDGRVQQGGDGAKVRGEVRYL